MEGKKVAANAKFLSYISGSGTVLHVVNLSNTGRQSARLPSLGSSSQHIQDQDFDPFNQNRIASVCTDGKLRIWDIPSDGLNTTNSSPIEYQTKRKSALRALAWHPSAANVIAVRGSRNIFVFDLNSTSKDEMVSTIDGCFGADILSFCWNYDGSKLVVTCKDKIVRVIDPRISGKECILQTSAATQSHSGIRFCGVSWLGDSPFFLTAGHNTNQDRELLIWDSRDLSKGSIGSERVDCGNMSSILPLYDIDTNLLVVGSKAGSAVRLYEVQFGENSCKLASRVNENAGSSSLQGCVLLPKQANKVLECEVMRLLQLVVNSSGSMMIQPVSIKVPRKESGFHADLFPDTTRGSPSALSSIQYFAGENANPLKISISSSGGSVDNNNSTNTNTNTNTNSENSIDKSVQKMSVSFGATMSEKVPATVIPILSIEDEEEDRRKSVVSTRLSSLGSTLKYRHLTITYPVKEKTFFDLKPCKTQNEGPEIACSEKFWATAYSGGGGPAYVSRHESVGRIASDCTVINGHSSSVTDIAFSPFDSTLMATASNDCTVKTWQLPHEGPIPAMGKDNALTTLTGFGNSVRALNFHPTCASVIACSSLDKTVRLFDIDSTKEMSCFNVDSTGDGTVSNLSWNYDGTQYALACKDRVVRVVDPRSSSVVNQSSNEALGRNLRVEWCCDGSNACSTILTVSVGASGMRTVHVWDPRNWEQPLCTEQVDTASGQLYPMYDASLGACFIAGKGDTIVRAYEMSMMAVDGSNRVAALCKKCSEFTGSGDRTTYTGVCMLPKRTCDIRNIECAKLLKLTTTSVVPVSFTLPRADNIKTYFQDDIFRPANSSTEHHVAGDFQDWLSSRGDDVFIGPFMESLQPEEMTPLSDKPPEEVKVSRVTSFKEAKAAEEKQKAEKEANFDRLQQLANQRANYHVNKSMGTDEVDSDDNWSD
jgi:coronin-7